MIDKNLKASSQIPAIGTGGINSGFGKPDSDRGHYFAGSRNQYDNKNKYENLSRSHVYNSNRNNNGPPQNIRPKTPTNDYQFIKIKNGGWTNQTDIISNLNKY